jgi:hypothetical protein
MVHLETLKAKILAKGPVHLMFAPAILDLGGSMCIQMRHSYIL